MSGIPPDMSSPSGIPIGVSRKDERTLLGADRKLHSVLVVEDDPMVTEVIADILTTLGYSVLTASDGSEAVSIFESSHQFITFVILDFDIPGLHSSRAFLRFKELNEKVKVILSSGYPESHIGDDFPIENADGFIAKPYDPQLLIDAIGRVVG